LDASIKSRLLLSEPPYTHHLVSAEDLNRLMVVPGSWLEKSRRTRLDHETLIELVAEQWQAHPDFIRQLNQNLDWSRVKVGTPLVVPNIRPVMPTERAAWIRISLGERLIAVFDARTNLVAHFPCSIARQAQDRWMGTARVASIALGPHYTFDPDRFPRSPEARLIQGTLTIPPGPNNPVGTMWIGLDLPGYGVHGTPEPERVGEAASLGCFRLSNWNAELLGRLAWVGMPVLIEP
jgi:lipoprotein-anchoring transpeptidase ErfK/SrfK